MKKVIVTFIFAAFAAVLMAQTPFDVHAEIMPAYKTCGGLASEVPAICNWPTTFSAGTTYSTVEAATEGATPTNRFYRDDFQVSHRIYIDEGTGDIFYLLPTRCDGYRREIMAYGSTR